MRLLTAVSGVRVPQQAPESTRKRVLLFCFGLSPLRVQRHARGQARRHAEPQWTRLRPRGRTIAIPSRCSLRGFESLNRRHRAPENGCFCFVSGSHPCACNGTRAGKPADTRNRSGRDCARKGEQSLFRRAAPYGGSSPVASATEHPKTGAFVLFRALTPAHTISMRAGKPADTRNRSGRDCAREGEQSLFRRVAPYGGSSSLANDNDKTTNRKESDCGILLSR